MKFTLSWLSEYISLDGLPTDQLADRLTMLGLEVDAVQKLYNGLESIVSAQVVSVKTHPNADRLTLCQVDTGDDIVPIVCGAPNVREGLITAIAKPGVRLPDGHKIKKAQVRGEVSMGMLCSWRELGIGEDHSGILELSPDIAPGVPLTELLDLDDTMIEIDLTPNRPDCASVLGIAREVAGMSGQTIEKPITDLPDLSADTADFTVIIEDHQLCPRYAARKLTNVQIGPSPWWLQRQLMAVGMRPVNNVVDITNFVMLEYGQPLHAFDFQSIAGKQIHVRCPRKNENTFTTLDNTARELPTDTLMICDADKPIAVAGVMGGLDSEVTDQTTEVLLESACFNPVSIRRTARTLNLPSEASYRFERGVDPDGCAHAMERAVQLMIDLAGATAEPGGVDAYPGRKALLQLPLRVPRVNALLGIALTSSQVAKYLRDIEFEVAEQDDEILLVTVPPFRIDIEREIDLVEEIARLYGYNEIPVSQPSIAMDYPKRDPLRQLRQDTASLCTAMGFYEAINYSFVTAQHFNMLGLSLDDSRRECVELLNPLSEDQSVMRTMLLPGLLENIKRNINFQQPDVALFEIGKVFSVVAGQNQPDEKYQLCAVKTGARYPHGNTLYFSGEKSDIFDMKGVAGNILQSLRLQGNSGVISFISTNDIQGESYAEGSSTLLIMDGETQLGMVSKLTRAVAKKIGIKQDVYFLELDLEGMLDLSHVKKTFKPLSRFPSVKRDIALLVPEAVAAGALLQDILAHKIEHVVHADIFDVYSGKPIEEGMKSVALTVTYQSDKKTLDDQTVDGLHNKIVDSLMSGFGGRYREGKE